MNTITINIIIISITVIVSIAAWQNSGSYVDKLIFWPKRIKDNPKESYRFITSGFIHADFMHLFFNLFTLYFFGRYVEVLMGGTQYLIFYILALIVSHITTYLKYKDSYHYRSLGASGAVSAVLFAFIFFAPWEKVALFGILELPAIVFALLYLGITFYLSKKEGGTINHDAHLWGSLFGWIYVAIFIDPRHGMTFIDNVMNWYL